MGKEWRRLALETSPKIVTLVGMGFTGSLYVPDYHMNKSFYEREDTQVWAVNNAALWYKVDMCCAMDDQERDRKIEPEYVEALEKSGIPVLTSKAYTENHIEYPMWEVVDDIYDGPILPPIDNTITAAIALCIHMKVERIRFYGIDFCPSQTGVELLDAYERQREKYGDVPTWFAFHERGIVNLRRDREPGGISSASFKYLLGISPSCFCTSSSPSFLMICPA